MSEALKQKNYYERLNVPRDASKKQITRAFREIASVYHPDAGMYGEEGGELSKAHLDIFVLITEAYNTLNDPEKRAAYDRKLGPAPEQSSTKASSSGSSASKIQGKEGWVNINRFDEEDRRKAQELREKFKVRDSAFEDGGEIRSSLNLGNLGQRTSILRSEIYKGGASDLDRDELNAMVEEEEEEVEEVVEKKAPQHRYQEYYSVEDESEDDLETESVSDKLRDLFDLRRPIIPLLGGLLFGIVFALLMMFLVF